MWDPECHREVLALHSVPSGKPLEGLGRRYDRLPHLCGPLCPLCGVGAGDAVRVEAGATREAGLPLTHPELQVCRETRPLGLQPIYSCLAAPTHSREAKEAGDPL